MKKIYKQCFKNGYQKYINNIHFNRLLLEEEKKKN